jgi:hypothetical protein
MSEREEGADGDPASTPAGERRRWRLTLTPRPWAGQSTTVRCTLFAGLQESDSVQVVIEASPQAGTWSDGGRSSIASSSTVKEFERAANGSRFWVLAEDDESEAESCVDGDLLDGACDGIRGEPRPMADAMQVGVPVAVGRRCWRRRIMSRQAALGLGDRSILS